MTTTTEKTTTYQGTVTEVNLLVDDHPARVGVGRTHLQQGNHLHGRSRQHDAIKDSPVTVQYT
jgi:hypothetical protein